MKIYNQPSPADYAAILARPMLDWQKLSEKVSSILEEVEANGDAAVRTFTERFDGVQLETFAVSEEELKASNSLVSNDLQRAIKIAHSNISKFHSAQQAEPEVIETMPGVRCWRKSVAIERVGLYIPGGTAPLFSTILMLGVPAKIAGCQEIVLCTPPRKDGSVDPAILFAAQVVGVTKIFKIGGAQAIAAMSHGTETVPKVYKIFGPGNQYVTAAKQLAAQQGTAIDMPAGPSEVMVVADHTAVPAFVAADLLSQAEHGVDSQVVLVAFAKSQVEAIQAELSKQLERLPRKALAAKTLENSVAIIVGSRTEAQAVTNEYAAEHLILSVEEPEAFSSEIINAGSIFLGNLTPESVGDYASGTNHTLPTNGHARAYSGVSLDSFVKKITFQKLDAVGLQTLGPTVEIMAAAEQLEAHKNAVRVRLESLKS